MISILSLWAPILLAAVLVFIVSSVMHAVLKYHQADHLKLSDESAVSDALRPFAIPPGDYFVPNMHGTKMDSPEFKQAFDQGPVMIMTVLPNGIPNMMRSLGLWFVYCLLVGLFAGYVASVVLPIGAPYMTVFRITGTVAFCGYALALLQNSIWFHISWATTFRFVFDGLVFALVTAGTFGWLWPRAF